MEVLFCQCQALSAFRPGFPQWHQTGVLSASVSFLEKERSHRVPNQGSTVGGGWQPFCRLSPETAGWVQKCETGRCHGEALVLSDMSVSHFQALFRRAGGQSNNRDTLILAGRQGVIVYLSVKIRTLYTDTYHHHHHHHHLISSQAFPPLLLLLLLLLTHFQEVALWRHLLTDAYITCQYVSGNYQLIEGWKFFSVIVTSVRSHGHHTRGRITTFVRVCFFAIGCSS
jgi:hypothetical protein